MVGVSVER